MPPHPLQMVRETTDVCYRQSEGNVTLKHESQVSCVTFETMFMMVRRRLSADFSPYASITGS